MMSNQKYCEHVYENVQAEICPLCGKNTHETDWSYQTKLHKEWHEDGKATFGGWWSI